MFATSRPDVTNEGWHSWPTEKVSHELVREPRLRAAVTAEAVDAALTSPAEVATFRLAARIRSLVEGEVREGHTSELNESLVIYALSRVDWLQLAEAQLEAVFRFSCASASLWLTPDERTPSAFHWT